jgi:hypothetical protein
MIKVYEKYAKCTVKNKWVDRVYPQGREDENDRSKDNYGLGWG